MKFTVMVLWATILSSCPTFCLGQTFWQDFSSAIPKVLNPAGTPVFNTQQQGFPSTSGFPQSSFNAPTSNVPTNTGFNNSVLNSGFNTGAFGGAGPMLAPARKDWKLGVYVDNREEGAVITQVAQGSAGQQAGLQPNDIIVAVGPSRIGYFDNRIIELAEEIRRNADPTGRVSLLVFNAAQRRLVPLMVSMNSTSTSVTGVIASRDRVQLPSGSALVVQLQNISNPYNLISGGKSVTRADGVGPYPFELHIDPRYLDPRDQYQLTAYISLGNQTIYSLPQPITLNTNNLAQPLSLMVESVSGGQGFGNPSQPNFPTGGQGNVVNVGYPGSNMQTVDLNSLFFQLLNRAPSAAESVAWQAYLQQGNSINELKIKLMSNIKFRERFVSDSAYVQELMRALAGRVPDQQELAFWTSRLQATQSPETVIGEMLQRNNR